MNNDQTNKSTVEPSNDSEIKTPESGDSTNNPEQRPKHICPTYHEEREDPEWQELHGELGYEPACGHAIDYLKYETGVRIKVSSAKAYASALGIYVEFLHERETNVCEATLKDLRDFFNHLVRLGRSEKTLNGYRTAIGNLYTHITLYREATPQLSPELIRKEIDASSYQTKEKHIREPLTKDELRKLMNAAETPRERLIIQIAVELGPRNQSIRHLLKSDVDLDEKNITIRNLKSGGEYELPISPLLALRLRRWINVERPGTGVKDDNPYLFPSPREGRGGRLSSATISQMVDDIAERAGIQRVVGQVSLSKNQQATFGVESKNVHRVDVHTLRHTFNHLLADAGIPQEARSAALDHSNPDVTKEFYEHHESEHKDLMKDRFSGISDFTSDDNSEDEE